MTTSRLIVLSLALATVTVSGQTPTGRAAQLLADLESADPTIRGAAIVDLKSVDGPAATALLIEGLDSHSPIVRENSARALGRLRAATAVPSLVRLLNDPTATLREEVVEALAAIGTAAVPSLITVITQSTTATREDLAQRLGIDARLEATRALSAIGADAVQPLLDVLARSSGDARSYFLTALARIDDARAVDVVVTHAAHTDSRSRAHAVAEAAQSLEDGIRFGELSQPSATRLMGVINAALLDRDVLVRRRALDVIATLFDMYERSEADLTLDFDVSAIIANLSTADDEARELAVWAIKDRRLEGKNLDAVKALMSDANPSIRDAARDALGSRGAAGDEDRLMAIEQLGDDHSSESLDALVLALRDPDPEVRAAASFAIGRRDYSSADGPETAALVALLKDPDRGVREAVISTLGELRIVRAAPALLDIVVNDADLRQSAVSALGGMRSPDNAPRLLQLVSHLDPEVRRSALRLLPGYRMWSVPRQ